jgi:hypothetical protein
MHTLHEGCASREFKPMFKPNTPHHPLMFKEKSRQEGIERFACSFLSTGLPLPLASFKHSPCDFQLVCHSTAEFIQFVPTKRFPAVQTNQHRFLTPLRHKRKFPPARKQARKPTKKPPCSPRYHIWIIY